MNKTLCYTVYVYRESTPVEQALLWTGILAVPACQRIECCLDKVISSLYPSEDGDDDDPYERTLQDARDIVKIHKGTLTPGVNTVSLAGTVVGRIVLSPGPEVWM